ncbi:MAG: 3-hydroxyacyl-CoA dehydrogenase [Betaproteobacteria bacterium]|nr:MAG: 3-hydroxyacyl-CoA dehydrogenase [Betaproteobacteria bacterium]
MNYRILTVGDSASFPNSHPLLDNASRTGDVIVILGNRMTEALERVGKRDRYQAVVVELGDECLGFYSGESRGEEGSNLLGFARFGLGADPATQLIELVRQPATPQAAIDAARQVFESAGLQVAVCKDVPGRIVNRLVRPYYNAALRRLDEGLATAADMDTTLKLGLGYPEGPIGLLERSGLEHHYDVTQALYEATGDSGFFPARRAQVAKQRARAVAEAQAWAEREQRETSDE